MNIELPQTSNELAKQTPEAVTISVDVTGQIFWNEEQLDKASLATRLTDAGKKSPQPPIHIYGDRSTRYDHVIQVMVSAQQAGLTQLGFVTEVHQ